MDTGEKTESWEKSVELNLEHSSLRRGIDPEQVSFRPKDLLKFSI